MARLTKTRTETNDRECSECLRWYADPDAPIIYPRYCPSCTDNARADRNDQASNLALALSVLVDHIMMFERADKESALASALAFTLSTQVQFGQVFDHAAIGRAMRRAHKMM